MKLKLYHVEVLKIVFNLLGIAEIFKDSVAVLRKLWLKASSHTYTRGLKRCIVFYKSNAND